MAAEEERLYEALEGAQAQFWAQIASAYPEAKYGDMGPEDVDAFNEACETAVRQWITWNVPQARFAEGDKVRHRDSRISAANPPCEVRSVEEKPDGISYTVYDPVSGETFSTPETDDLVAA
jgi:hypothetical protein